MNTDKNVHLYNIKIDNNVINRMHNDSKVLTNTSLKTDITKRSRVSTMQ